MSDALEYIDDYFEKKLSDKEKQLFEERCVHDENFAGEVAAYITAREGVRQSLLEQKKQLWSDAEFDTNEKVSETEVPVRKMLFRKLLPYAAAACLLMATAGYLFYPSNTPEQFARDYVSQNFNRLSQTMDGSRDSLQLGIAAYNNKDYDKALLYFNNVYAAHPDNSDAIKYSGLVYLIKKDYDKALPQFDELAEKKGLFSNSGLFLKALTLLERNKENDKAEAKKLLEQVVAQKLENDKEAAELLKKW